MALAAFAYVVTIDVGRLADNIPAYETNIQTKIDSLQKSLPSRDMLERGAAFLHGLGARSRPPETAPSPARSARQHGSLTPPETDGKADSGRSPFLRSPARSSCCRRFWGP